MVALDMACQTCTAAIDTMCNLAIAEPSLGRYHLDRIHDAARAERKINQDRRWAQLPTR